jgi:hypothetical protein
MGILLIAIALSAATADTAVSFSVDTAHPGAPLSRVLLDSFGSSHGSTTLRATWRSHFSQTLRDIPFRRVRFHGILDDDMSSFRAQDGNGGFSGGLIFDTLDFFVANGITPTVELSYMPAALALNSTAYYRHYMGIRSTFASAPQWRAPPPPPQPLSQTSQTATTCCRRTAAAPSAAQRRCTSTCTRKPPLA